MSENEKKELESTENEPAKKPAKVDAAKKGKPAEKKKKGGIGRFFREMKSELKKVAWPTRKQTVKNTGVVLVCVLIVGVFVWIFDGVANALIGALLHLFGG